MSPGLPRVRFRGRESSCVSWPFSQQAVSSSSVRPPSPSVETLGRRRPPPGPRPGSWPPAILPTSRVPGSRSSSATISTLGANKMPCQYCHYTVAESNEPGIPSMQTCMGCHLVIGGSDSSHKAEIKKLREAWSAKQPIEWVRIHKLARHVHFPHMSAHQGAGPQCLPDLSRRRCPHAPGLPGQQHQQHGFLHHLSSGTAGESGLYRVPLLVAAVAISVWRSRTGPPNDGSLD